MILNNVQLIHTNEVIDIEIAGERILNVYSTGTKSFNDNQSISFENATVLPGLINSHDHLDFNLFPQLGDVIYNNYKEWAFNIHRNFKEEIAAVLRVPEALRVQWGIYKNFMCGVTTVVNHGKKIKHSNLITVLQDCQSLHSVSFEKKLKLRLNNPLKLSTAVVIHAGEGTDEFAANEIDELVRWNLLKRELIGIHGVAMSGEQAKKFKALVWCPASNYFLFNKTTDINLLKGHTTICFGSDSTLTSNWNIWEHIRLAENKTGIAETALLEMLTLNPAVLWRLNSGRIEEGKDADIIVAKRGTKDSLLSIDPEEILLVIHKGIIRLFDDCLYDQVSTIVNKSSFSTIRINTAIKHVEGNLPQLIRDIQRYYPNVQLPCKPLNFKPVTLDESN